MTVPLRRSVSKKKLKSKKRVNSRTSKNLFDLAEAVSWLYGLKNAEAATEELREVAWDYRTLKKELSQTEWLGFVVKLVFACPVLLKRPEGFEWVTDDFRWALTNRKLDSGVDKDLWKAFTEIRRSIPKGRPSSMTKDLFRFQIVHAVMYPTTTDPEKGLIQTKGANKSKAVEKVAEMESHLTGKIIDPRVIWRSMKRVENYLDKIRQTIS